MLFFGSAFCDVILFEVFDPDFNKLFDFGIEDMVARWESR